MHGYRLMPHLQPWFSFSFRWFHPVLTLPLCPLIPWRRRNCRKEEPWSADGSLLPSCKERAAPRPALQWDVLAPRQDGSRSPRCQDCPARPCCPLEINIQRKQRWCFGVLRERNTHVLPKSKMNTRFAKQFALRWEITSCQVVWKKQNKQKNTPPSLSESDQVLFPISMCKVGQGALQRLRLEGLASCFFVQGCIFINVGTMMRQVPSSRFLHDGDSPGETPRHLLWRRCGYQCHSARAVETRGGASTSVELWMVQQTQIQQIQRWRQMMTPLSKTES